jgi:hypothetical protein
MIVNKNMLDEIRPSDKAFKVIGLNGKDITVLMVKRLNLP